MSIELPPIPPQPTVESTPAEWDQYLRIVGFHLTAAQIAVDGRMVAAQEALVAAWAAAESGDGVSEATLLEAMRISRGDAGGG